LCDGQKIPHLVAEHIGLCQRCQSELSEYATIGAELRRLASIDESVPTGLVDWKQRSVRKAVCWQKGLATMKVPRLAFAAMLIAIVAVSSGLVIVRARAGGEAARFLELEYKLPPKGTPHICVLRADGSPKDNLYDFVSHLREGLLLMNTRVIASSGDRIQLWIRAKYILDGGDSEVNYTEALFLVLLRIRRQDSR
jgi:hypothetical protein